MVSWSDPGSVDYWPSYGLKFHRASEHFVELERLIAPYDNPRPYEVRHSIQGKRQQHVYTVHAIGEPDPFIAVVLGELLFALRSALDHLRVAIVPRKERYGPGFPIFTEDPFRRVPGSRKYVERSPDNRRRWISSVRGMDPRAIREIANVQPFRWPQDQVPHMALAALSRLNNADKHRELVPVFHHLNPTEKILNGESQPVPPPPANGVYANGATIHRSDREMQVEACGALVVVVAAPGPSDDAGYPIMKRCKTMLDYVEVLLGRLAVFDPDVPRLYELRDEIFGPLP